jgi:hypothetical protein
MAHLTTDYIVRMKVWKEPGWYEVKETRTWNFDGSATWDRLRDMLQGHVSRHSELGENLRIERITNSAGNDILIIQGAVAGGDYDCWLIPPGHPSYPQ